MQAEIIKVLFAYVQQQRNLNITLSNLIVITQNYAKKLHIKQPELTPLIENTSEILTKELEIMEQEGMLTLRRSRDTDNIFVITYTGYYRVALRNWYQKMLEDPSLPFPSVSFLNIEIPENLITHLNIATDLQKLLREGTVSDNSLINLSFDIEVADILVTNNIIHSYLEDVSFMKLHEFLKREQNSINISAETENDLPTKSIAAETLRNFAHNPKEEQVRFQSPSNAYYHFWLSMYTIINKQLSHARGQHTIIEGQLQANKLLHSFISYYYEMRRDDQRLKAVFHKLNETLYAHPYVYSTTDLANIALEGDTGQSVTIENIADYLQDMSQPKPGSQTPHIVRFKTMNGQEHIIATNNVLVYFYEVLSTTQKEIKEIFSNMILNEFNQNKTLSLLKPNTDYNNAIEQILMSEYPILYALLNYRIIELSMQNTKDYEYLGTAEELIDTKKEVLRSYAEIMQISQPKLKKESLYFLPVWSFIPVINVFFNLFYHFFRLYKQRAYARKEGEGEIIDSKPVTAQRIASSHTQEDKNINILKNRLTQYGNQPVADTLESLIQRWNQLIDKNTRANLTEDVNALCRDALKHIGRIGKNSDLPSEERIQTLAERLAENPQLKNIRDTKALQKYMQLYMTNVILNTLQRSP